LRNWSLDAAIDELERAIAADHRRDPVSRLAASVPGVGALAASAILASAPDPHVFKSGRDFAAWLGVTPKQNSTGGKEKLGSITKQGNRYIRRLLVLGGRSRPAVTQASEVQDRDGRTLLTPTLFGAADRCPPSLLGNR
jgi:transposase